MDIKEHKLKVHYIQASYVLVGPYTKRVILSNLFEEWVIIQKNTEAI